MAVSTPNWRSIYFITIGIRFCLTLADSYIHPDEHFQSFEPLGLLLGYSTNPPWEFSAEAPARSYALLMLLYYPVIYLSSTFGLLPLQTRYLARLELMLVSWVVTDWCLYRMLPTKQERIKAIYFALTSYVTLVYQSHTFSNSVETVLVMLTVFMINELRFLSTTPENQYNFREIGILAAGLGVVGAIGVFNRVTFPAFFVFPAFFYLQCWRKWRLLILFTGVPFLIVSALFIVADTAIFTQASVWTILKTFKWDQYKVAPLNNLIYNTHHANLAQHGIHPYYTHAVINLPQLLGPGLAFVFYGFKNRYWRTTPFVTAASGLFFLSLVPHQEVRFLIPVVPLLCCCFDMEVFDRKPESSNDENMKEKTDNATEPKSRRTSALPAAVLNLWYLFNSALALLMGIYHQGGVVPAVDYLHDFIYHDPTDKSLGVTAQIWWRTYSPPTWMLGDKHNSTQFITLSDDNVDFFIDASKSNLLFDTMGLEIDLLQKVITTVKSFAAKTYLITPVASFNKNFDCPHNVIWKIKQHLDMDHLDIGDIQSLQPGLGIFELL
ncbi:CIC11C00000004595 [Sungouiella intermedia]|uniref:Mannosyltransferase n=1 Tax=Sungouiella intermedia TaxID=45354 RepID=A0A1L0DMY9_9ASCO|nr:CIC11C00000004595 [[Candida] intermedia]